MKSLLVFALLLLAPGVQASPDVAEIVRRLMERADDPQCEEARKGFAYQRTSRVEYLHDDGTLKRDVIRVYQIAPENGEPVTRLLSVNGRPASGEEEKKRSAMRENGEKGRTLNLSQDILSRYDYTFLREEEFASRPTWVLAFIPKPNAPEDGFFDRLVNAMSGTLWIDQEDYQLAKAELGLSKRISFFGGIAGAIDKIDLTLIQRRIEPAVWLGEAVHIDFAGRKLFSTIRFRCFENCADFQRIPSGHASAKKASPF